MIRFLHATGDHKFLVDAVLSPEQGITHDVFKEQSEGGKDPEDGEEGEVTERSDQDIIQSFKHVYVPEVVREPRMRF